MQSVEPKALVCWAWSPEVRDNQEFISKRDQSQSHYDKLGTEEIMPSQKRKMKKEDRIKEASGAWANPN